MCFNLKVPINSLTNSDRETREVNQKIFSADLVAGVSVLPSSSVLSVAQAGVEVERLVGGISALHYRNRSRGRGR